MSSDDDASGAEGFGGMDLEKLREMCDKDRVKKFIASLPVAHQKRVRGLEGIQKQWDDNDAEFMKEKAALQKKYEALFAPLWAKRAAIISGEAFATEEETKKGLAFMVKKVEEEEEKSEPKVGTEPIGSAHEKVGVPDFWYTALTKCQEIAESIEEHDEEALKALTDIRVQNLEHPKSGFTLTFYFRENEYFENSELTKKYEFKLPSSYDEEEPDLESLSGCEIKWKAGKDLTVKTEKVKQKNNKTKTTRWVTKTVPQETFFGFFNPPAFPLDEDEDEDDEEDDKEERLENDTSMGVHFKDILIPHAVEYYCGEIGDDDDEDEEDEEEEDSDDDDDEGAGGKTKPKSGKEEAKQECKQQ